MELLIVDDEMPSVEGTLTIIDWASFGFDTVHTANSLAEAVEVMERSVIDLLVCDIEMPGGSGIELIRFIRPRFSDMQIILLTAHENFKYAKEAVSLGCREYILKPAEPATMETAVHKAVNRITELGKIKEYRKYSEMWLTNQPAIAERFWQDILSGSIPSNEEAIEEAARRRLVPYTLGTKLKLMLIRLWHGSLNEQNNIKSAVLEFLKQIYSFVSVLSYDGYLTGICVMAEIPLDDDRQLNDMTAYIKNCHKDDIRLSVYIGGWCGGADLPAVFARLRELDKNNVQGETGVFSLRQLSSHLISVPLPDYSLWADLLRQGLQAPLIEEIKQYRSNILGKHRVDAKYIVQFHNDFLQMVYTVLNAEGLQAHRLFENDNAYSRPYEVVRTIDDLFEWAVSIVSVACSFLQSIKNGETVMEKIERYVASHIGDNLTRSDIAGHVYLNPDYLNRIVKRETGLPISEYIQNQRMAMAKKLLTKTNLSVSEVALHVGYQHFSQFSKIFRKYAGISPSQYRQENQ